ncbi:MAG: hypothetical protein JWM34_1416 [Ilumatobacteraceae bacterium]|nr:hypothetical protein [Ilumatobacteraceae bacterium]
MNAPLPIGMHIHSFGMRFHFQQPDFDVFDFVDLARREGFTGVNVSANGPGHRDLRGTTPDHFDRVRHHVAGSGLRLELDTSDTRVEHLTTMLGVAAACGADTLRVYTKYAGTIDDLIDRSVSDLTAIAPVAERHGVLVVFENHEDFQGAAIARILERVDSPWVRALYDYGNSQMVGEDPFVALAAMAAHISRVHLKDHVMIVDADRHWVQGVAVGDGRLPIIEQTRRLHAAGVRRFCFENVWGYVAPLLTDPDRLPGTPAFVLDDQHPRLDARDLPPADAVAQEQAAFRRGWDWLRASLADAGFTIEPEPLRA